MEGSIYDQELKENFTREYGNINGDWLKSIACVFQNSVMVGEVYDNISATVGDVAALFGENYASLNIVMGAPSFMLDLLSTLMISSK